MLYEIYTGKRAFEALTVAEMSAAQRSSVPTSQSSHVKTLDAQVERVILRCLSAEPEARPASVKLVAAALPGGTPLAAALAAGETPSPEMVAAAGSADGLPLLHAWELLGLTLVLLFLAVWLRKPAPG